MPSQSNQSNIMPIIVLFIIFDYGFLLIRGIPTLLQGRFPIVTVMESAYSPFIGKKLQDVS